MSLESNKFEQPNTPNNILEDPIVISDTAVQSLRGIPHEERERLLKELRALLKPGTKISTLGRKRILMSIINLEEAEAVAENGSLLLDLTDEDVSKRVDPTQRHGPLEESEELHKPENNQN